MSMPWQSGMTCVWCNSKLANGLVLLNTINNLTKWEQQELFDNDVNLRRSDLITCLRMSRWEYIRYLCRSRTWKKLSFPIGRSSRNWCVWSIYLFVWTMSPPVESDFFLVRPYQMSPFNWVACSSFMGIGHQLWQRMLPLTSLLLWARWH